MRPLLLASLLAVPAASLAQTPSPTPPPTLPETVVTATRIPTLIESIPAGVTVIDRATIETRGYTTLPETLEAVPGLRVVQSGGLGGNASVFIRGTNSDHVLVLRDGVPINDPSDPGGLFNFGVDTLADIERIEIVRGPMSSLYGSGAIGGVINLITRRASPRTAAASRTAASRSPPACRARCSERASLSGRTGAFDYSLDAEGRSDQGSDTTPRRESVYTGARNGYRTDLGSLELGYTPADGTRLSFLLRGRHSVFGLDELGFPAYDAADYTGRDDSASRPPRRHHATVRRRVGERAVRLGTPSTTGITSRRWNPPTRTRRRATAAITARAPTCSGTTPSTCRTCHGRATPPCCSATSTSRTAPAPRSTRAPAASRSSRTSTPATVRTRAMSARRRRSPGGSR